MSESLPINRALPQVIDSLRRDSRLILVAEPGAGKTTRIPPALLASGLLGTAHPQVVLLQPRRVAARAAAARIAEEWGCRVGEEVGYQIRFERRVSQRTRLRVVTEGLLTRQLLQDPFLEGVGAVVLDEFHERSLHTDLALALLREVRETVRPDLILVVMSATLEASPVAAFLGGAPVIQVEGRPFPVTIEYSPASTRHALPDHIVGLVERLLNSPAGQGDILVFLPGMEEIRRALRLMTSLAEREDLLLAPLHGSLSSVDQDRALRPAGRRKVILATNIAETSLTIEGVRTVIDSGLARAPRHDPQRGLDRLELVRISRASATQRAGRAGRTGPGLCLRLWSERDDRALADFDEPEIRRVDLASSILALHAWGQKDPGRFGWFEAPPTESLLGAERTLLMLGALDPTNRRLTSIGQRLLDLPVHPRIGRLLLAAVQVGRVAEGAMLAALLSEQDVVRARAGPLPPGQTAVIGPPADSDLLLRRDLVEQAERSRFPASLRDQGIDPVAARKVVAVRDALIPIARRIEGAHRAATTDDEETLLKLILVAYPDRVARRRGAGPATGVMVGGRGVRLEPTSAVREAEFFLALDPADVLRAGKREARVRIASAIRPEWLEECFPETIRQERQARFDPERGRVVGVLTTWYNDLVLSEEPHGFVAPEEATAVLAEALHGQMTELIRGDERVATWLDRVACLRRWRPDLDLPDFADEELTATLKESGYHSRQLEEFTRLPWIEMLSARLNASQRRSIDELAPEAIQVPSGNRIRLSYTPGRPPILAVRLQELFGWTEAPRVAGGQVPVVLHLLGPNFRPVQITEDLGSFWSTAYFQVRKDLRARYPRHAWPDDPLTARAEAKGGRKTT